MNRQKFMSELEILLQDISENDRLDAIAYYNDYFDEAGKENEELIIRELGSPKRVADTIKNSMAFGETFDAKDDYGEYTERGYSDSRSTEEWKAPIKAKTKEQNGQRQAAFETTSQDWTISQKYTVDKPKKEIPWALSVILLIFASPVLIGVIAGLFGGFMGLVGALFGVTVGVFGAGFGVLVGGVICFVVGFVRMFSNPMEGLASMGVGALLISVGILLTLLFILLVSKWLPVLVKGFIGGCKYVYRWAIGLLRRDDA